MNKQQEKYKSRIISFSVLYVMFRYVCVCYSEGSYEEYIWWKSKKSLKKFTNLLSFDSIPLVLSQFIVDQRRRVHLKKRLRRVRGVYDECKLDKSVGVASSSRGERP